MELKNSIKKWRGIKMPKRWKCKIGNRDFPTAASNADFGYCYAVKIPVLQGFYLVKIGATRTPKSRLSNIGRKGTIFCLSPPHLNFWENEEILHEYFQQFRVPARPGKGVQGEFFNISLKYFFEKMPELSYVTEYDDAIAEQALHYGVIYKKK